MRKIKPFLITFEGIEGSGKTYQSKKLYRRILNSKLPVLYTREPGGTKVGEKIRDLILSDYFSKNKNDTLDKYTDTLLYLAARNEHVKKIINPSLYKKKIIICDRFIDSTFAYQVYGKKVNNELINIIHKNILNGIKPDITFILKTDINKALQRLKKRRKKNRYDKFTKKFYMKVQSAFLKLSKSNKRKYFVVDNSFDTPETEKKIFYHFSQYIKIQ